MGLIGGLYSRDELVDLDGVFDAFGSLDATAHIHGQGFTAWP